MSIEVKAYSPTIVRIQMDRKLAVKLLNKAADAASLTAESLEKAGEKDAAEYYNELAADYQQGADEAGTVEYVKRGRKSNGAE